MVLVAHFTQMIVWQKAIELAGKIHDVTKSFPKSEQFELVSQMRRASFSVSSNIAEGFGRHTVPDKKHKYIQARGELIEVITGLYYCARVKYLSVQQKDELLALATEVHKMLNALITKVQQRKH